MKDQNTINEEETVSEKWERGRCLFMESLLKPDSVLRACAHNQKCYNEFMEMREVVIEFVKKIPNPHEPKLKPGEYNNKKIKSFNGISVSLLRGSLGKGYMKDWTPDQVKEYEEYEKTIKNPQ